MNGHNGILESQEDEYDEQDDGKIIRNTKVRFQSTSESKSVQGSPLKQRQSKDFTPLVLVGPSGAGKSTLVNYLQGKAPESFTFSVSSTTR